MTHSEHLAEAQRLHGIAIAQIASLESEKAALSARVIEQAAEIASLKAQIAVLEAEVVRLRAIIDALTPVTPPPPEQPLDIWDDRFDVVPDAARYVFLARPQDIVLESPGNCRFTHIAGRLEPDGDPVLRTELMIRAPGTNNAMRADVGKAYRYVFKVTIPADYDPRGNDVRHPFQCHEIPGGFPPAAWEIIRPNGSPWNGQQNLLRVVAMGDRSGAMTAKRYVKVSPGDTLDCAMDVLWRRSGGWLRATVNGVALPDYSGETLWSDTAGTALHFGIYAPGSKVGTGGWTAGQRMDLIFHRLAWGRL